MYSLVDVDPKKEYGIARLPEWKAVQDGLKRNLVAMLNHYRHASYSVASDHLLVQVLQSINIPLSLNDERYASNIRFNALSVANALQFTTPFGQGKIFQGVFFNRAIHEVIVGFDEPFDIKQINAKWQDATPVRVLRHPFTQLDLQIPNGRFSSPQAGLAIVAVNVALLAVQYRAFRATEAMKQQANPDYIQRNVMQFIHMYVLPNMLESYLDYALFNRINHLSNGERVYTIPSREAIHMPGYTKVVDSIYKRQLKILENSSYTAPMTLAAVPVVSVPDLRKVMFVPDVAPTRQILWSVILARLPMLLFLVRMAKVEGRVTNQSGLHNVQVVLLRLKNQRVLDSTLPAELYQPAMAMVDEILGTL